MIKAITFRPERPNQSLTLTWPLKGSKKRSVEMRKKKFYSHQELHQKWMKNPKYRREYEKLEPEFQVAMAIIEARIKKKITQEELAKKAKTGQAVISRLENMNGKPSVSLLQRIAEALNLKLQIRFLP